ncbi:Serine/threonine-protein kinase [Oleoguttula sp. CCFEE 5521]
MAAPPRQPQATSSRRPPPPTEPEPDKYIGDFRRGNEIGKGSFATVYLAQHREHKSYAAVKVVHMAKLTKKLKENLDSEISILKSLQHPHIVAMFSLVETPIHIYLIMEYCQLADLSQFMKKRTQLTDYDETKEIFQKYPNSKTGGLNEVLARHFLKQIASALQYLRGRNLIHRDIKPQNLLLNPSPEFMSRQRTQDVPLAASEHSLVARVGVDSLPMLKIADFGFARHLPSTSMAETLCGSPLYMAPEILRYEKYDARADLWSTGTVLYEMVVGKPPFRAQNHVELLRRIEKANDVIAFDRTLELSRGMKDVIRKLLRKSPLDRVSYEDFFLDPVITEQIPGLVGEDVPLEKPRPVPQVQAPEPVSAAIAEALALPTRDRRSPEPRSQPRRSQDGTDESRRASRKPSDQDLAVRPAEDIVRRKSSSGTQTQTGSAPRDIQRQPAPRERRPSIVAHATAPGRQELYSAPQAATAPAPRMERRPSRASPLSGPPMVREQSVEAGKARDERAAQRAGRERTAQDIAFEKEYVVIEKRQVEVNAFADELDANAQLRNSPQQQGAMVRRGTTQGGSGGQPPSPSRGTPMVSGRIPHQRNLSFERRLPGPQSATTMMTKVLTAANVRLSGALGISPPFGKGPSPPHGYTAFPSYPVSQGLLLLGDGTDGKLPMDEDSKVARTVEDAGHRSDVIFGFAEVKYRQLLPATPSTQDGLGIQQLVDPDRVIDSSTDENDKDMTTVAIVGVAEEALVLYVKTLSILAKTIDLAGLWWNHRSRGEVLNAANASPRSSAPPAADINKRMNNVVQWARSRFNECLEKSEVVGRILVDAQRRLPVDHPANPVNRSSDAGSAINTSRDQIQITSGVTAEKLMFDRAVEMSRAAAVSELVGDELQDCELQYVTSIMLYEAVLESDDEPLMPRGGRKERSTGEEGGVIQGMEGEDREKVVKLIEGARNRLSILRKKLATQQQTKRSSLSAGSGSKTAGAQGGSATATPTLAGTPPR